MNFHNFKKLIFLIGAIVLISALVVYKTDKNNHVESNQNKIKNPIGRTGRPISSSEMSSYENKKALEAYEKRNAEITPSAEKITEPNQSNAAQLYYQAFLLFPDFDLATDMKLSDVFRGEKEPDTEVRTFLGKCLPAIELYDTASRIPQCTWEVLPENQLSHDSWRRKILNLSLVCLVDARTLASDGKYQVALEKCLAVRRFARQLCEDSELYIYSQSVDQTALIGIRNLLGIIPPDADILMWFQGQADFVQGTLPIFTKRLQALLQERIMNSRSSVSTVGYRNFLLNMAANEQEKENIRNLADDQLRTHYIEVLQNIFGSIFKLTDSDVNNESKLAEMQEFFKKLSDINVNNPLMHVSDDLKKEIDSITKNDEMTNEQKLAEIEKMINESTDANVIEVLRSASNELKMKISIDAIIKSQMTEQERQIQIQKLSNEIQMTEAETEVIIRTLFKGLGDVVERWFESQIRYMAITNSTKAALEVYLILAKTGKLPDKLPDYLPKDPYMGRDFVYEITTDGFVLGCNSDKFNQGKERFAFKIQKPAEEK
jgi:hypothetical protein